MAVTTSNTEQFDSGNANFQRAAAFVKDTNQNLFLTGKAGTGKTTFLKYIKDRVGKQCAIVAPTGVAAINAGGETIHSFLQLPFGPFVPGTAGGFGRQREDTQDKHSLLANLRLRDTKLKLLRKLELLIIDEVSMVRCDLLDSMDLVLRHVRKNWSQPFGGVQMVFIGDLFQLPPVAPEQDWEILRNFYASPYFFDAVVLRQNPPLYIELKKIYRQKEQAFIDILNRIRNGLVEQEDIDTLNTLYNPELQKEKGYIILSTHNRISDAINQEALEKLPGGVHTYKGTIRNEFNPKNLPTDEVLVLKKGAQVMFIKNDLQTPRRYYNGKIATVESLDDAGILVSFPDEPDKEAIQVELETWKNMRYTLNQQKGEIEEEESGSFTQYPIRLAWAITVHKSQGLTLQKAVVDLNQSFAPGQVYVALSRCTTMEGLVLRSKLNVENVIVDSRVVAYAQSECEEDELDDILEQARRYAAAVRLCKIFSFAELLTQTELLLHEIVKWKSGPRDKHLNLQDKIMQALTTAEKHAGGFRNEIQQLMSQAAYVRMYERKQAAIKYFTEQVMAPLITAAEAHTTELSTITKVIKQAKAWKEMKEYLIVKDKEIKGA
jgi:ATP-dependent exoDNAse (exonuclease V) alpha subunit